MSTFNYKIDTRGPGVKIDLNAGTKMRELFESEPKAKKIVGDFISAVGKGIDSEKKQLTALQAPFLLHRKSRTRDNVVGKRQTSKKLLTPKDVNWNIYMVSGVKNLKAKNDRCFAYKTIINMYKRGVQSVVKDFQTKKSVVDDPIDWAKDTQKYDYSGIDDTSPKGRKTLFEILALFKEFQSTNGYGAYKTSTKAWRTKTVQSLLRSMLNFFKRDDNSRLRFLKYLNDISQGKTPRTEEKAAKRPQQAWDVDPPKREDLMKYRSKRRDIKESKRKKKKDKKDKKGKKKKAKKGKRRKKD